MNTLPTKTSLRIRKPTKALAALVATMMPRRYAKLSVVFSSLVPRRAWAIYAWYDLATGEAEELPHMTRAQRKQGQAFEVEPGDVLCELESGELELVISAFGDAEVEAALDIARDAWLAGRKAEARRMAQEILPRGWPLFLAVLEKETNRAAPWSRGANCLG